MKNKPFIANEFYKTIDTTREVVSYARNMAICLEDGIVIITKQQAMDFWGLVDPSPVIVNSDGNKKEICHLLVENCTSLYNDIVLDENC